MTARTKTCLFVGLNIIGLALIIGAVGQCPPTECYDANADEVKQEKCEAAYSVYFRGHCHTV